MADKKSSSGGGFDPLTLITDITSFGVQAEGGHVLGAPSAPQALSGAAKQETHYAPQPFKSVLNATSAAGDIASFLTSTENWLRIGEVIAGLILLAMGLRTLAGRDTTPVSVATGAAKTAVKAVA